MSEVRRRIRIPDLPRVARARRAPEVGPEILFFSGGTALREVSRTLVGYTHNSTHIITPFDSGGSSAKLREAFDMLSIGDLRNRLLAVADGSFLGNSQIYRLFSYRLPMDEDADRLHAVLGTMASGEHPLVADIPEAPARIIRTHLHAFLDRWLTPDFDLAGASIGNLILSAGFLENGRHIDAVLYLFSRLVEARGHVLPVVEDHLHLGVLLEDETRFVGQHLLAGKETAPIASPVRDLYLVDPASRSPARTRITPKVLQRIEAAEVLCFPMGSFYSSVIANLLPEGVGNAVAAAGCPKVFVPNAGKDPEQLGMTVAGTVERLLEFLRRDAGAETPAGDLVHFVLVDTRNGGYAAAVDPVAIASLGVEVLDVELFSPAKPTEVDPLLLTQVLLSLA